MYDTYSKCMITYYSEGECISSVWCVFKVYDTYSKCMIMYYSEGECIVYKLVYKLCMIRIQGVW